DKFLSMTRFSNVPAPSHPATEIPQVGPKMPAQTNFECRPSQLVVAPAQVQPRAHGARRRLYHSGQRDLVESRIELLSRPIESPFQGPRALDMHLISQDLHENLVVMGSEK